MDFFLHSCLFFFFFSPWDILEKFSCNEQFVKEDLKRARCMNNKKLLKKKKKKRNLSKVQKEFEF